MTFCPYCGTRVGQTARPAIQIEPADESSIRLATVLFGDVKGFTAMSEHLPPEEVTDIMNACFEALSQPILQYGGSIDKYVGDAIMARFGAPQAHEDDPVRAIHAGLEMQRALTKFAAELKAARGFELAMRIGINTGQVMAAKVGAAAFQQFTLMGNTVNLASRLEHEAEPGSVLVGETTYRLAKHAFEFRAMPPLRIRGQSEPINSFVPLRPRVGVSSSRSERTGRRLQLVGRSGELDSLDRFLNEALEGHGRLVALVGDPGVGKSRLVEEFWKRHEHDGLVRIYASAPSFGESMPYSMLAGFIRSLVLGRQTDQEVTPEQLRRKMQELLPARYVDDAVALLGDVLGIEGLGGTDVSHVEARSRQAMLTNTLKQLLETLSKRQPLLLNLEDMHWVDTASLGVFDQILTAIQNRRIMALLTQRSQFSHAWASMAFYRQINVRELPARDARTLLTAFFGSNEVPTAVGERVMEKAGGNPFFLEQLLNNLADSGAVVQRGGRWVLAGDIESLTVPDTIQEILLARIDQLARGARSVLEVAAVIGRVFAYRLLEAVASAERNIETHLQLLQRQEFIQEKTVLPELEYMFKHSLTHDVVYNGLPEARRRVLHERVAEAIESLGIAVSSEQLPLLAIHYEKTANREKALEYTLAAANRARQLYANQDAVTYYRQALDLIEHQPQDGAKKPAVLEALADVYAAMAEFEEAYTFYSQAREAAATPSDRARLLRKLGDLAESRGRYAEALTSYREAEDTLDAVDDPEELVNVWLALARMDRSRGALESASEICLRALSIANRVDEPTGAALYFELGEIERERGHLRSASGYLEASASVWAQMGALEKQALVEGALAKVCFNRGELAEALGHWEKALDLQQRVHDRQGMGSTLFGIGGIRVAMGDLDAAIERFNEALSLANEIDFRILAANCMVQLGNVYLERGDVERAQQLIEDGYRAFRHIRNWRGTAHALVARARLLRARGDSDHARTMLRRAMSLTEEMRDPWLQAQICIGEAELEEEAGRLDLAAEYGTTGMSMARDLSDVRLVARAERILGRVRARQGQRKDALTLLASAVETQRRCGARVDAARAALDYAITAQGASGRRLLAAQEMIEFAIATFEATRSTRDLRIAQAVAQRLGAAGSLRA